MKLFTHSRKRRSSKKRASSGAQRAHHQLVGLFTVAAALLVILDLSVLMLPTEKIRATSQDNVKGWAWSSTGGWLSMNSTNEGAAVGYGVNIDPATKDISGFAWSPSQGWVCIGSECNAYPVCAGDPPGSAAVAYATIDASGDIQGWGKICNLGSEGWISLNCANTGVCGTSNYKVHVNYATGQFSGFAWHNTSAPSEGWGWIDFSDVYIDTSGVEDYDENPSYCTDTIDNDLDGAVDCEDSGCMFRELACPSIETNCSLIGETNCCENSFDDDYDGTLDCNDTDCASALACQPEDCENGIDDNGNGLIDCADSQCDGHATCENCSDGIDNNGDTLIDCDDPYCSTSPECTPAWLRAAYGNIYATLGIEGNAPPVGQNNSAYCLSSAGAITGFSSALGCEEEDQTEIALPIGSEGYVSRLGRLDVTGILNGRYGQVVNISNLSLLPASLGGKVYVYDQSSCTSVNLPAKTFLNASGGNTRGSGLLVINGCDLNISDNLDYQSGGVSDYLRNLASFGVIVLAKYDGTTYQKGGNLTIDPSVTQVVGTIFAERSISTGSTGMRSTDSQLKIYGAIVSHQINFQRRWSSATESAELVEFDGRAVVNPPPGFQDISKSLPTLTDKY